MNDFEIGEKVVCVNAKKRWYKLGSLKKNEIYTITGFNPYDGGLILKEVKSPKSGFNAYAANRFRKVDYNFVGQIIQFIQPTKKIMPVLQPIVRIQKKRKIYSNSFISLN